VYCIEVAADFSVEANLAIAAGIGQRNVDRIFMNIKTDKMVFSFSFMTCLLGYGSVLWFFLPT
jgi:hypothetical protein